MSEMRTMASSTATATKPGAGGKGGEDGAEAPAKKGKMKLIIIAVVALLVVGGAAYWFLLKPSGHAAKKEAKPAPVPGAVITVDPISVNLADGHYLKIGIALQETASVKEAVDGSKALDAVIDVYSGQPMATLADPAHRDAIKKELVEKIAKLYDDEVYDVYFTSYVMQ